jgi:hypothetical protein
MILLTTTDKLNIVVENEDLLNGNKNFKILCQQRLYDGNTYKCISDPTRFDLYKNIKAEYEAHKPEAEAEFDRQFKMLCKPTPAPAPTPEPAPAPTPAGAGDLGIQLQNIMLKVLAEQSVDKVMETAKPVIDDYIKNTYGVLPKVIEVKTEKGVKQITGVVHEKFEQVLKLINAEIPVFMTGGAGTGKNVIAKQVAESLGLEFYFTNAVTQEYKLTGFIDANGTYQETQFFKAFTQGGLFFLDEMDASIPEVLIILNAALANGYFDFPCGKFDAHPDFRVISAGNTFGTGADIEYTGRFQLDGASLDRFAVIEIDYSPAIEEALADGDKDLLMFVRTFRKVTYEAGIKCIASYRTIERIKKMKGLFDLDEVLKMALLKGLREDDVRIIRQGFQANHVSNEYTKALA